jgi:DNA helicase-2/ATP-dependent DNA helicase PcrA
MTLDTFHQLIESPTGRGYPLNLEQRSAVDFGIGPLWLIAGPGSGKTEVLVTRTLKLLCVDGVHPASIFLTTFTQKAAKNLEDRLASYLIVLQTADPTLASVDLADLRIGTLHGLCNNLLQEIRYPGYQNVRLLDDVEQHLFAYRYAAIGKCDDLTFWQAFGHAVPRWQPTATYPPNQWQRIKAAILLFNHIIEDNVDLAKMRAVGGHWATLAKYYEQYADELHKRYRCDFAHLQARFLDFLNSPASVRLLDGDGDKRPPLTHILVDEYQDTNPIQERIYLALAKRAPHNLTVVGDDDQALYRFRGGTVAGMVHFDDACLAGWGVSPHPIQLLENYRSHPDIVDFFNDYITSFDLMKQPGVRAPGKLPVKSGSAIRGSYPAVAWISSGKVEELPIRVGDLIQNHLLKDGIIKDLSQCVLLVRSAKDSERNAGPYIREFARRGIPVYNPRSKSFMDSEEVQCLLASLIHIIDLDFWFRTQTNSRTGKLLDWAQCVNTWIEALDQIRADATVPTDPIDFYIKESKKKLLEKCRSNSGEFLELSLQEILYRILAHEPFLGWRQDPTRNQRLSKITRLFESYHTFQMDILHAETTGKSLASSFLNRFYVMFLNYLIEAGIDDEEDEDVIIPAGYLPIMTIHQSKGLEFPFVIVGQLGGSPWEGSAQILEGDLAPFRNDLYSRPVRPSKELAMEDDIRLFYVAYSRAEYGLILSAAQSQIRGKNCVSIPGGDFTEFRRNIPVI